MKSLQAHFLVATRRQVDPNFVEAVILVVKHSDRGAFGLIVNCPRDRHLTISRQRRTRARFAEGPRLYFGGPVTGPPMAVHTHESLSEIEVLPGVFFAGKEKNVLAVMRSPEQPCKVFTGYTGWGPRQLEHELENGTWRAIPATPATIFFNGGNLWNMLMRQAFDSLLQVLCHTKHLPSDTSLN